MEKLILLASAIAVGAFAAEFYFFAQMRKELDALRKKNDQEARDRIIRKGKDQGKLTPSLIRMLAREPVAKAEAMLEALPVLSREQRDAILASYRTE